MSDNMSKVRILMDLKRHSADDPTVSLFLVDLVLLEADNAGEWRWKDIYRKKILDYVEKGGATNEN